MKKFLLGIILPLLTLVTIIGTGFATWYFDGNLSAQTKEATVGVFVEKYAQAGYITVSEGTYKIKLDQPKYDNGGSITAQNITLYKTTDANTAATLTGTYHQGVASGQQDSQADYTKTADFTITVTLTPNLAKYITLDKTKGWSSTDNLTFTKKAIQTDGKTNNTLSLTSADFKYATRTSTGTGSTFNPVGAPQNLTEYTTMIDELVTKAEEITVKFDAKIPNPNKQ